MGTSQFTLRFSEPEVHIGVSNRRFIEPNRRFEPEVQTGYRWIINLKQNVKQQAMIINLKQNDHKSEAKSDGKSKVVDSRPKVVVNKPCTILSLVKGFIFGERGSRRFNEPRTGCRAVQVPFSEPRTANRLEANRGSRTVKRTGSEVRLRTAQSPGEYSIGRDLLPRCCCYLFLVLPIIQFSDHMAEHISRAA